ncbi:MAG: hypothetical protein BWY75_00973 [bacterium ADurb.Bin425]|nr:MAG: hypothetical protein BWY75_00973 [bacterium ADurb.Bin425]
MIASKPETNLQLLNLTTPKPHRLIYDLLSACIHTLEFTS